MLAQGRSSPPAETVRHHLLAKGFEIYSPYLLNPFNARWELSMLLNDAPEVLEGEISCQVMAFSFPC
jgi:hypothetical protein